MKKLTDKQSRLIRSRVINFLNDVEQMRSDLIAECELHLGLNEETIQYYWDKFEGEEQ